MDYTLGFSMPENTHSGRLLALARCVFERHYREELRAIKGPIKVFNTMCSGDLERVANVLRLAGFIEPLDDSGIRSVFICGPDDFKAIAKSQKVDHIDHSLVDDAVICLAGGNFHATDEIEFLAQSLQAGP